MAKHTSPPMVGSSATLAGSSVVAPRPRVRESQRPLRLVADPDPSSFQDRVESIIRSLFGVGLELTTARLLLDGEEGERLDQAMEELDSAIRQLREQAAEVAPKVSYDMPARSESDPRVS